MEALCKFLKTFLQDSTAICWKNFLLITMKVNTRRRAVPVNGVKQLTFAVFSGTNGPTWNSGVLSATAFLLYVLYILEFFGRLYTAKFCSAKMKL